MILKMNANPSPRGLRQCALTLVIGFSVIGGLLLWRGKTHAAVIAWITGVPIGLLALMIPSVAKTVYKVWMGWAFIMGTLITNVILAILFFGVIAPVAVVFRCMKRDPLDLKKNSNATTYWSDHRKITDRSYYQRLF